jgi:CRP-like cAMP-binding protein
MKREAGLSILASRGWLAETPAEFQTSFLSFAQWRHIEKGATVTLGGEEKDDVIGLAHGTVAATTTVGLAETPTMHIACAVFWLGYGPLLLERPRVVTVEARTDLWVAEIPQAKILPLLDGTTKWWRCFMRLLVEYGDTTALIASDLLIRQSDRRLAATILRFAGPPDPDAGPAGRLRIPVTQTEVADASNLSRNAAGTILRALAAKGYIETDYGGIAILDRAGLQHFVVGFQE